MDLPIKNGAGYVKIAIENGDRNSGFTHKNWVDLSSLQTVSLPEGKKKQQ